jgi:hypothetical protein
MNADEDEGEDDSKVADCGDLDESMAEALAADSAWYCSRISSTGFSFLTVCAHVHSGGGDSDADDDLAEVVLSGHESEDSEPPLPRRKPSPKQKRNRIDRLGMPTCSLFLGQCCLSDHPRTCSSDDEVDDEVEEPPSMPAKPSQRKQSAHPLPLHALG